MAVVVIQSRHFLNDKVEAFTESVIPEMTRECVRHGAVNLAQGFPDFPAPAEIKRAAQEAIAADVNQYAITWGAKSLRNAIARQMQEWQAVSVNPETQITVCCGSTEAMISTLLAVCNKGDEVGILVSSSTCWQSRMRFMNTFFTTEPNTFRWPRSRV